MAEGSSISHAIVAALVAYFLSLEDLGGWLRRQNRTPKAMIDYLKMMSYRVNYQCDAEDETMSFEGWYGTPIPDPNGPVSNYSPVES